MKIKKVLRYDPTQRKTRLFRLLWIKGIVGIPNGGHSAKLAFSIRPVVFRWQMGTLGEWRLVLFGVDIHYLRSAGGVIA